MVKAPLSMRANRLMASKMSDWPVASMISWAIFPRSLAATSVSVEDTKVYPSVSRSKRSLEAFSMIPLWISATLPSRLVWG